MKASNVNVETEGMPGQTCAKCGGTGWQCEQHPDLGWPHDDGAGPSQPCEDPGCQMSGWGEPEELRQDVFGARKKTMTHDDWAGTVKALSAASPAVPIEHVLWKLTKGARTAEARVRPHPLGHELRFVVNGDLLWSEVFKASRGVMLGELAETKRVERR